VTVSFERVGVLVLSAALSAGMLAVVPAASASSSNCDELVSNYDPRVKHSRSTDQQIAECKKSKEEASEDEKGDDEKSKHKQGKHKADTHEKSEHGKGKHEKSKDDED
jgi:hypothetical protein